MRYRNRLGSICLTAALLLSTIPIQTYGTELVNDLNGVKSDSATSGQGNKDDTHGNAGNNDGTGQEVAGGGDFCTVTNGGTIGVRFSIIDPNNPTEVIGVLLDDRESGVVDILYSEPDFWKNRRTYQNTKLDDKYTFSAIKTQPYTKRNPMDTYTIDQFDEMVATAKAEDPTIKMEHMPRWMDFNESAQAYRMNGTAFKNWFWTNSAGEIVTDKNISNTEVNINGANVSVPKATEQKNSTKKNGETTSKVTEKDKPQKVNNSAKLVAACKSDIDDIRKSIHREAYRTSPEKAWTSAKSRYNSLRRQIVYYNSHGDLTSEQKLELLSHLNSESSRTKEICNELSRSQQHYTKLDSLFGVMTAYAATTSKVKVEVLAPGESPPIGEVPDDFNPQVGDSNGEAADASKVNDDANIKTLLRFQRDLIVDDVVIEKNVPIFRLKDTDGNIKALNDPTIQRRWILVVEPIVYLTIYRGDSTAQPKDILHQKVYGTISNVADYLGTRNSTKRAKTFNYKAIQHQAWGALTLDTSSEIDNDTVKSTGTTVELLNEQGETTFTFTNLDLITHKREDGTVNSPKRPGTYQTFEDLAHYNNLDETVTDSKAPCKVGYGVNLYWGKVFSNPTASIKTWDENNYPNGDSGPAPDASNRVDYPEETTYKENANKFKIVKFYYFETGELTDDFEYTEETLVDVQTREGTPHVITVMNEGNAESDYYWQVQKWATGKEDIVPQSGDLSRHFEDYVKSNLGEQAGDASAIVTIPPESSDKVLYVKLLMKEIERPIVDIVKVYENGDTVEKVEVEEDVNITDNKYKVKTPDGEYTYIENAKTQEILIEKPKSWENIPANSTKGTETDIPVDKDINTIYIRYKKEADKTGGVNPVILHEDELAFPYDLDDLK